MVFNMNILFDKNLKLHKYSVFIFFSLLSTASIGSSNFSKTASLGIQCDELAAIQNNPDNPANIIGIDFYDIDSEKAIEVCSLAVAKNPNTSRYLFQLARAYESNVDYKNSIKIYTSLALSGYAPAQSNLGIAYNLGLGVDQDYSEALSLFRKSAEQDFAVGQYNLGMSYYYGLGITESNEQALIWFRKAANQNHMLGQFSLGNMYEEGLGVPQSNSEAIKWYKKAANQGYQDAVDRLRDML